MPTGLSSHFDPDRRLSLYSNNFHVNSSIRDRHLTGASATTSVRPFSRDRAWTSPSARQTLSLSKHCSGGEKRGEDGGGVSSDVELSSYSSTSSSPSEIELRRVKTHSRSRTNSLATKSSKRRSHSYKWKSGGGASHVRETSPLRTYSKHRDEANQAAMLDSLTTINSQLGTLLDRLGTTQDASGGVLSSNPYRGGPLSRDHTFEEYPSSTARQSTR